MDWIDNLIQPCGCRGGHRFQAAAGADVPQTGTISKTSFVAISANASAPENSQVSANFPLSPVAQVQAEIIRWTDNLTVLDLARPEPGNHVLFGA